MSHKAIAITTPKRREIEILKIISYGYTIDEISSQLFISEETVKSHRKNLLRKLHAKNGAQLIRRAFEYKLLNA